MNENKIRFESIADIKTVCLLMVLLWHSSLFYEDNPFFPESSGIISKPLTFMGNIFNVTLIASFVFCSGFLYNYSLEKKHKPILKNIWGRVKRLLVPYYVCGTFWLVPFYTFFNIRSFGRPENASFFEGLRCMLLGQFSDHLWFLWMLFWVTLFFILLSPLVDKKKMVVVTVLSIALAVCVDLFLVDFPYFKLSQIGPYVLCFLAGILFYQNREKIGGLSTLAKVLCLLPAAAVVLAYAVFTPQHFVLMYIARLSGAIMFFFIFEIVGDSRAWCAIGSTKGYSYIKAHSMTLYCFNMPFPYLYFRLFFPHVGATPWLCTVLIFVHALCAMVITVQVMMFFNGVYDRKIAAKRVKWRQNSEK